MHSYSGIPAWIAANHVDIRLSPQTRSLIALMDRKDFVEEPIRKVLVGMAAEYPSPEHLSIHIFTDKESLARVIRPSSFVVSSTSPVEGSRTRKISAEPYPNANYSRWDGAEHFDYSAEPPKLPYVRVIIRSRASPYSGDLDSDLLIAASEDDRETALRLIRQGADVDARNSYGNTPLISAAQEGNTRVARLLLQSGALPNLKSNDGWTALMAAASKGDIEIVRALVAAGADVNAYNEVSDTALSLAAYKGHTRVVTLLLTANASADARDESGNTPLINAAMNGHSATVNALLRGSAAVNARNNDGETALMLAYDPKTALVLVKAGADLDAISNNEENALFYSVRRHRTENVRVLLRAGANPNATNGTQTVLSVAKALWRGSEVVDLLKRAGAVE
jgi:ankyrin repeat protein